MPIYDLRCNRPHFQVTSGAGHNEVPIFGYGHGILGIGDIGRSKQMIHVSDKKHVIFNIS